MVKRLCLVVYHERSRRVVPADWAVLLTDGEDDATEGPKYHAVGSPFTGYKVEVQSYYSLAETNRYLCQVRQTRDSGVWPCAF